MICCGSLLFVWMLFLGLGRVFLCLCEPERVVWMVYAGVMLWWVACLADDLGRSDSLAEFVMEFLPVVAGVVTVFGNAVFEGLQVGEFYFIA